MYGITVDISKKTAKLISKSLREHVICLEAQVKRLKAKNKQLSKKIRE